MGRRVGVFGWGIVAPRSPNIDIFAQNLKSSESWLSAFHGFGPDNFLVGTPEFDFSAYRDWIDARFPPRRFAQLEQKIGLPSLYAIGAFIQSLGQNEGIEAELERLGPEAHVYVGTGLGDVPTLHKASLALYRRQRAWDMFWADVANNSSLRKYLSEEHLNDGEVPPNPVSLSGEDRLIAEENWNQYWTAHSPELMQYLDELCELESTEILGDVETGKASVMRTKERLRNALQSKWGAPEPPWHVSSDVLWNIPNTPAAQISMLGRIKGLSFAPVAACSTFGVSLRLAIRAIQSGDAKAVVVGATDPPPHPLVVGAFYSGRVLPAIRQVSLPLTRLQGTHVAGGSVVWIVGDYEHMTGLGFKPLGMEPLAVGVSSDAYHIITPTIEGPTQAIMAAMDEAEIAPNDFVTWDLHATATPGDYTEVDTLSRILPSKVLVSARKGTFGHGMSAGGGWELTAQYLGYEKGQLFPTPIRKEDLNASIANLHDNFVFDTSCEISDGYAGKLSTGIGGINACVVSRSWNL